MPLKKSTADTIIDYCNKKGVTIILDGGKDSDSAKVGTPYSYYAKDKILTVLLVNLKPTTKQKLIPFFKEKWEKLGIVLKLSQQQTLESYIAYKENHTDNDIIDFFSDKIPGADLDSLKMSLFLRSKIGTELDINLFKQQIRERFGERGIYISNLCSSGYFENDFMPYYDSVTSSQFDRYYELSVGRELKAIFVHSGMTRSSFRNTIEDKMILARRFEVDSFKIHGLGGINVDLIKSIIGEYESDDDRFGKEFEISKIEDESNPPSVIYQITLIPFNRE